ncbi:ribonuclease III domain-containing protein, partial [Mycena latifolia]
RLEFLGDSVLRLVLTRLVLEICPDLGIGPLTSIRNFLVCNAILAKISVKYKLPDQMEPQLRQCKNVQADVFESYIGGLYEDQGLECVQTWLEALFRPHVIEAYSTTTNTDANGTGSVFLTPPPDSVLSYIEQWNNRLHNSDKRVEWVYSTEHPKGSEFLVWSADVFVGDEVFGHGMGRTKTAARDAAAKEALVKM